MNPISPDAPRAFVGIECALDRLPNVNEPYPYQGAYVCWGLPRQVHNRRVINTGSPVRDFDKAFHLAFGLARIVIISGTADFFVSRSNGRYILSGSRIVRATARENAA